MEKTKKIGMKWYNYLVHFWLPLNIFLTLLLTILVGRVFSPVIIALFSPQYEVIPSEIIRLLAVIYLLLCIFILPLFYTIGVRKSLRKCKPNAPKQLAFWYIMPILFILGFYALGYIATGELPLVAFSIPGGVALRALIMIPLNARYFNKRAELFGLPQKQTKKKNRKNKKALEEEILDFEAPIVFEEIPQVVEQSAPSKKTVRRKNPSKLMKKALRRVFIMNPDGSLPF